MCHTWDMLFSGWTFPVIFLSLLDHVGAAERVKYVLGYYVVYKQTSLLKERTLISRRCRKRVKECENKTLFKARVNKSFFRILRVKGKTANIANHIFFLKKCSTSRGFKRPIKSLVFRYGLVNITRFKGKKKLFFNNSSRRMTLIYLLKYPILDFETTKSFLLSCQKSFRFCNFTKEARALLFCAFRARSDLWYCRRVWTATGENTRLAAQRTTLTCFFIESSNRVFARGEGETCPVTRWG